MPITHEPQVLNTGEHNPLVEDERKDFDSKIYSEKDKKYISFLQTRLENGRDQKNNPYPEFNDKTYWQVFDENERVANTKLPKKKNKGDVIVSAGTVEQKLDAVLAHLEQVNLSTEVHAYDRDDNKLAEVSRAFDDIMYISNERDGGEEGGDKEKKLLRQRELLKQGNAFVQEEWLTKHETKKKLRKKYKGEFKLDDDAWSSKLEKVFEGPSRTLLHGPNVYLGNITKYYMNDQPFIFFAIHQDYEVARAKYGKFENWQYVDKGTVQASETTQENYSIYDNKWRLTDIAENQVEILIYQDQPNDEFQIIINGVLMLPVGFPLSAVAPGGKYNIAKQVFRPINANFAYGSSFVSSGSIQQLSKVLDEMLKLMVLKTRKSYTPPYINATRKVISPNVLQAGQITMNIPPDALIPIGQEGQGVTSSEFAVLKELSDRIDKSTVSPQFAGQQGRGSATATENIILEKQSKLTLGLTIASCSLLEKKLGYLRLWNVLENWFEPVEKRVVTINGVREMVNKFRKVTREVNIDGEGLGEREINIVENNEEIPEAGVIREMERQASKDKNKPVRKIFLSRAGLKGAKINWEILIVPKEKENSNIMKLMFREELSDMMIMMNLGSVPNVDGLEERFARVWGTSRDKVFGSRQQGNALPPGQEDEDASAIQGRVNQAGIPGNAKQVIGGGASSSPADNLALAE